MKNVLSPNVPTYVLRKVSRLTASCLSVLIDGAVVANKREGCCHIETICRFLATSTANALIDSFNFRRR